MSPQSTILLSVTPEEHSRILTRLISLKSGIKFLNSQESQLPEEWRRFRLVVRESLKPVYDVGTRHSGEHLGVLWGALKREWPKNTTFLAVTLWRPVYWSNLNVEEGCKYWVLSILRDAVRLIGRRSRCCHGSSVLSLSFRFTWGWVRLRQQILIRVGRGKTGLDEIIPLKLRCYG